MKKPDYSKDYRDLTNRLLQEHDEETAKAVAVGGDFRAVGRMEYYLLRQLGLRKEHRVIDVGCGSGRLTVQLRDFLTAQYVGMDVVPELLDSAAKLANRPDWAFYLAPGTRIPEPDDSADFICFFSVFTHLLHEESYKYLEDSRRVIKPGGKIVFSFLEFAIDAHWTPFLAALADNQPGKVLTQFMSRDGIKAWASHLGLRILGLYDSGNQYIRLDETIHWDDGREVSERGNLGQSVCVLGK